MGFAWDPQRQPESNHQQESLRSFSRGRNTDLNKVSLSAVIKMRENAECGRLGLLGVADRVKRAHCSSEPENNEDCL